jgi:molybdopterin molybdotransferase
MISEEEARSKILNTIQPLPERMVSLSSALECFSAQDLVARLALPNFDNSAMDGYAVIANDCRSGARVRVIGEQPAGLDRRLRISSGEAVRIFTGAPIPSGADAIVMQEDVTTDGIEIVVNVDVDPGEFIRKRGCDLSEGQKILSKGERIRPTTLALLAAQGIVDLAVGGEVSAALISTGDELAKTGENIGPGQIYESNSTLLQALLQRCGAIVKSAEHSRDHRESLIQAIKRGIKNHILIITGGVSVGEHDLVQSALRSLGARIEIWRVAVKPGKPFLFGRVQQSGPSPQSSQRSSRVATRWEADATAPGKGAIPGGSRCFIFGLPGNPVSAFVTFLQFVRPAILKMMGASDGELDPPKVPTELIVDLSNEGDRVHYIRGKIENGKFWPVGRQESHALFGFSQANALLRLKPGESAKKGTIVELQLFD